ncbi:hypothetical protein [Aromatoleum diolicum]|uniref:Uncharacterized protein n=1 Tax=Aromatoleum diolicum TaxID=75796 RepID=A0ABX1QBY3_9RHOO|nr:hypothetical protein [Aromatoleum diolicum]NMG75904.1 hypothetical protein [Aromatoleum diolicum]
MQTPSTDYIGTGRLDCEFIPPFDLPEADRIPWERQLSAARAWQEAGGNGDGSRGGRGVTAAMPTLESASQLTMGTVTSMNTLLVSLMERLLELQTEVANVALAEMSLRHASPFEAADGVSIRSPLHADNARLIEQLANSCAELMAAAQIDMSAATGIILPGARTGRTQPAADQPWLLADRRKRAQVIEFPDRRAAA